MILNNSRLEHTMDLLWQQLIYKAKGMCDLNVVLLI